jgi:hypothetical protein
MFSPPHSSGVLKINVQPSTLLMGHQKLCSALNTPQGSPKAICSALNTPQGSPKAMLRTSHYSGVIISYVQPSKLLRGHQKLCIALHTPQGSLSRLLVFSTWFGCREMGGYVGSAPTCYGSSLGLNPDISLKYIKWAI